MIYEKLFYKIGEVAEMTALEPYVLRYWETEFNIRLTKSKNNQRLYQQKDIELIHRIKTLLYDEKFTIAGARKKLREKKKQPLPKTDGQLPLELKTPDREKEMLKETLRQVRKELEGFLDNLKHSHTATTV